MVDRKTVSVGPFQILDLTRAQLVKQISLEVGARVQKIYFALHVGGLNHRKDKLYAESMQLASGVYADGASVVLLARIANPKTKIERSATTDIAWDVIQESSKALGRKIRVALIGGEPHVAESAGVEIENRSRVDVCYVSSGFIKDWDKALIKLSDSEPDLVFVGLGSPFEAKWVIENRHQLPKATILTCGGWFGFVAGREARSPLFMQNFGLEWLWRLVQSPRRLAPRYLLGLWTFSLLALKQLRSTLFR